MNNDITVPGATSSPPRWRGTSTLVYYMDGDKPDLREFRAEATKFCAFHRVPSDNICPIPASGTHPERRFAAINYLKKAISIDRFVYFGHGWKSGIQLGWSRANCWELIEAWAKIRASLAHPMEIVLYACSTADGVEEGEDTVGAEGGFADKMRDCMVNRGIIGNVVAHKTAGHTTRNPYLVRCRSVEGGKSETDWIVAPRSEFWPEWVRRMKTTEFRYQVPFLDRSIVEMYLLKPYDEFRRWFRIV